MPRKASSKRRPRRNWTSAARGCLGPSTRSPSIRRVPVVSTRRRGAALQDAGRRNGMSALRVSPGTRASRLRASRSTRARHRRLCGGEKVSCAPVPSGVPCVLRSATGGKSWTRMPKTVDGPLLFDRGSPSVSSAGNGSDPFEQRRRGLVTPIGAHGRKCRPGRGSRCGPRLAGRLVRRSAAGRVFGWTRGWVRPRVACAATEVGSSSSGGAPGDLRRALGTAAVDMEAPSG